jgi:hypothetical protein
MYQYYFEAVFVVTRALDAYREAHSTPVPELDADLRRPLCGHMTLPEGPSARHENNSHLMKWGGHIGRGNKTTLPSHGLAGGVIEGAMSKSPTC